MHYSFVIAYEWTSCLGIIPSKSNRLEIDFRTHLEMEDMLKYLRHKAGLILYRGLPHKAE